MNYQFDFIGAINEQNMITLKNYIPQSITSNDVLTININSLGGSTSAGIAIYNMLKQLPCHVFTHNLGEVSSAAMLLYLAGETRTASDVSKFMIHPIKISMNGDWSFYQLQETLNNLNADIRNYYLIVKAQIPEIETHYNVLSYLQYDNLVLDKQAAYSCGIVTNI